MLKTAKIVGLNSDTDAAIALVTEQPQIESDQNEQKLHLFVLAASSLDDAFTRTRQTLADAENVFYSSALTITERVQETYQFIKNSLQDAQELHLLLAATQEETADTFFYFLGQTGSLEAYLVRGEERTDLCSLSAGQIISGIIKDGDRIIMATTTLERILQDNLQGLEKIEIEGLEDEIMSKLPEAENYPVAAIVIEKEKIIPKETGITETKEETVSSPINTYSESGMKTKAFFRAVVGGAKKIAIRLIPRSKRSLMIVGGFLLLLLVIGGGLSYKNQKDAGVLAQRNNYLQVARNEFDKAQALKDSNTTEAVLSLNNAKTALDKVLTSDPQNTQAQELKKKIEESLPDVSKTTAVSEFPVWLDLDLIKKGFSTKAMSLSLGNLLLLDTNTKTLVKINLEAKSQVILAGQDKIGNGLFASLNGAVAFVFAKDKGIIKIDSTNNQSSVAAPVDEQWGNIAGLYAFGGNIYLLDKGSSQIWKYLPTESGYSDKRAYLKGKVDLSETTGMEIDSSIWLLKNKTEIIKLTQGVADFFSYANLDKPVKDISAFYVADATDNLYVLDKGNNRLLVLDKKGSYVAQYTSDKFSTFIGLVVDETKKQVYLLGGSKIFSMDLK